MFGGDGDGAIRSARDGTFMVKGIVFAEVNDETDVPGAGDKSDGGADLNAERFVGLGVWGARFRGGGTASAAPDIDGARRGSGAASVGLSANACEIGPGANVILDSIFGFLASDETSEEKRQAEQTDESREITINLHWTPHVVQMGIESPVRQKAKL
jgi:hypothetical protein